MDRARNRLKKRSHQSEHKQQISSDQNSKFKKVARQRQRHYSTQSNNSQVPSIQVQNQRQYNNLQKKLAQKQNMKAGTRNFSKTFYTKLAKKIIQKPISFFKFGLKQHQKSSCKNVFSQLFKIQPQKLKGTLSICQLWDNKSTIHYLKQNEMFFNKDILMKQFASIDKQHKLKKRQAQLEKQREFVNKYRQMLKENQIINENNRGYQEMKGMNARDACNFIRGEIEKLGENSWEYCVSGEKERCWKYNSKQKYNKQKQKQKNENNQINNPKNSSTCDNFRNSQQQRRGKYMYKIRTKSRKIIEGLQKDYQKFDKIADKFKNRMIVLL